MLSAAPANIISNGINLPCEHGNTVYPACAHTSRVCKTKTISRRMWVECNGCSLEDADYIACMFAVPVRQYHHHLNYFSLMRPDRAESHTERGKIKLCQYC